MENFKLPKKWYIEITEENKATVNEWKIKQEFNEDLFTINCLYNFVSENGAGKETTPDDYDRKEITFEQFKKYVLKIEDEIEEPTTKDEDYSYLIPIMQQFKIS